MKPEFHREVCAELRQVTAIVDNLIFSTQQNPKICFASDIWLNPVITTFESISDATRILKAAGKFWQLYPLTHVRRSNLILENLRKAPTPIMTFPIPSFDHQIGVFSLLDKNTLVYATKCWKKIPFGKYEFIEDKVNPPNRAYLKLWEALSLWGELPQANELAMDLGASPGGWTYVMQALGAKVIAVDKAELAPHIAKLPRIEFLKQSAFALEPSQYENVIDWLLCDVACYPERLYELVIKWIQSKKAKRMIFTIKLQGETDLPILKQFQEIPGARILHLYQNKHEATFFYPAPQHLFPWS